MQDDDITRIKHMRDTAEEILELTEGLSRSDLEKDRKLSLALVHLFEILGEAASRISNDFQTEHPEIPWKYIIGMRNRLIHGYFDIDLDIVWSTVKKDIPPLIPKLKISSASDNVSF
ncbi:MAG: DUF86 domain-containing protein [Candidatus Saliniplasma sp.]